MPALPNNLFKRTLCKVWLQIVFPSSSKSLLKHLWASSDAMRAGASAKIKILCLTLQVPGSILNRQLHRASTTSTRLSVTPPGCSWYEDRKMRIPMALWCSYLKYLGQVPILITFLHTCTCMLAKLEYLLLLCTHVVLAACFWVVGTWDESLVPG